MVHILVILNNINVSSYRIAFLIQNKFSNIDIFEDSQNTFKI